MNQLIVTPASALLPAQLFAPTPKAAKRVLEFFTAQINNDTPARPTWRDRLKVGGQAAERNRGYHRRNTASSSFEIQTCIVHLIRNSLSFCNWKDRKRGSLDPILCASIERWPGSFSPKALAQSSPVAWPPARRCTCIILYDLNAKSAPKCADLTANDNCL